MAKELAVPKVFSQKGQLYVNVFGKCLDSTWLSRSRLLLVVAAPVWEQIPHT